MDSTRAIRKAGGRSASVPGLGPGRCKGCPPAPSQAAMTGATESANPGALPCAESWLRCCVDERPTSRWNLDNCATCVSCFQRRVQESFGRSLFVVSSVRNSLDVYAILRPQAFSTGANILTKLRPLLWTVVRPRCIVAGILERRFKYIRSIDRFCRGLFLAQRGGRPAQIPGTGWKLSQNKRLPADPQKIGPL
jgi:hypothetical protein